MVLDLARIEPILLVEVLDDELRFQPFVSLLIKEDALLQTDGRFLLVVEHFRFTAVIEIEGAVAELAKLGNAGATITDFQCANDWQSIRGSH
jgi:hypothetical protein